MVRLTVKQREELLRALSTQTLEQMVLQGETSMTGLNHRLMLQEGRRRKRFVLQQANA